MDFKRSILFFYLLGIPVLLFAQQNKKPILERQITITLKDEQADAALNKIAQAGNFSFSYNPGVIDLNEKVTIKVTKASVREVLEQLFHGKISYSVKGNYIILQRKRNEVQIKKDELTYELRGYVIGNDGEKLSWVSVYDKKYLASAVTNEFGFFKLKLKKDVDRIYVSKQGYPDTSFVTTKNSSFVTLTLSLPVTADTLIPAPDTVSAFEPLTMFDSPDNKANTENIRDTLYRAAQVSFIPYAGSNGLLSANVINNFSFNVLGGISMGTNGFELGGLFNFDRGDVRGFQAGGLFNAVGGDAKYLQIGGLANVVRKNVDGFQAGGLFNAVGGDVKYFQIGGLANVVRKNVDGFQAGGLFNGVGGSLNGYQISGLVGLVGDSARAFQAAGIVNVNRRSSSGFQIGGLANTVNGSFRGFQISGLANTVNGNFRGLQISGLVNMVKDTMRGCQIGFVNYAKHVSGVQIGFYNHAKTMSGTPIGFISFINDGYHKLEISADEIFYTNIAFRSGVPLFHNIVLAGIQPDTAELPVWTFGYGFGTTIRTGKVVWIDLDVTSQQIVKGNDFNSLRLNNKIYLGIDMQVTRKFSVFAGASYNGLLTERGDVMYASVTNKLPEFYETYSIGRNHRLGTYFGWRAGFRFF